MKYFIGLFSVVAIFSIEAGWIYFFYRMRVMSKGTQAQSDLLVFGLPIFASAVAFYFISGLFIRPRGDSLYLRNPFRIILASGLAVISFALSLLAPFNAFGT